MITKKNISVYYTLSMNYNSAVMLVINSLSNNFQIKLLYHKDLVRAVYNPF